jgi:hypothetical protein
VKLACAAISAMVLVLLPEHVGLAQAQVAEVCADRHAVMWIEYRSDAPVHTDDFQRPH